MIDLANAVVKLCIDGMSAEMAARHEEARALFERAWDVGADDFEACVAAHFLARQQKTIEETLRWNEISLERAEAIAGDARVRSFYPSLFLNLSRSHEVIGNSERARHFYELAAATLGDLPEGAYGTMIRSGIENARERLAGAHP